MLRTTTAIGVASVLGGAAVAQAETVGELIPAIPGTQVLLSDENREELLNREGAANIIDVGDVITGVFGVEQLFVTEPGSTTERSQLLHLNGNSELSGEFRLRVVDKTEVGVVGGQTIFDFVFGVDDSWAGDGQTLVRVYEDETGGTTYFNELDDSKAQARSVTTDGDLWLAAGLADPDNYWVGQGVDDITLTGPSGFRIGDSVFALNRTGGDFDLPLAVIAQGIGSGEFVGTSNIGPGLQGSAWELSSNTNFNFRIVPTPAAVAPGLALLGLAFSRRRRD